MGFGDFLGGGVGENPYTSNKQAFDQYGQAMGKEKARFDPYFNRGNAAGDQNANAYSRDINNPNAIQDQISKGFSVSPFQQQLLDLATKRLNFNSANSGMMGSGAANRALMEELTKNIGQFQNQYIERGMGVYNRGLQGNDILGQYGLEAGKTQADLAQEEAGGYLKGQMSENETNDRNRASNASRSSNQWGSALGIAGGIAGNIMSGPVGGAIGKTVGGWAGGGGSPSYGSGGYSASGYNNGSY